LREGPVHRTIEARAELPVPREKSRGVLRQAHPTLRAAAGNPLDELEAGGSLELAKIAPGVAVRHREFPGSALKRSASAEQLEEPRATVPEFQVIAEDDPDLELGLHARQIVRKASAEGQRRPLGHFSAR